MPQTIEKVVKTIRQFRIWFGECFYQMAAIIAPNDPKISKFDYQRSITMSNPKSLLKGVADE